MSDDDVVTLRRRMDEQLSRQIESDRDKIDALHHRVTSLEATLNGCKTSFEASEDRWEEVSRRLISITERITILATQFTSHIEAEERHLESFHKSNEHLENLNVEFNAHCAESAARLGSFEKMQWALIGFIMSCFAGAIVWAFMHMHGQL